MRKIFLTFGDGGLNFIEARDRLMREAASTGMFDEIRGYKWSDIKDSMVLSSPLRQYKRGCGYWLWKPAIINAVLEELNDGDILVYCDSGDSLSRSSRQWRLFFAELEHVDIICKRVSACGLHRCRKELLEAFSAEAKFRCRLCYQYEMGATFLKKTPFVCKLIGEWLRFMVANPENVIDAEVSGASDNQLPTFIENRHDQSVFSLLIYKYLLDPKTRKKIKTVWEFHQGWWLLGEPCIATPRNRSGVQYITPVRKRIKRFFYRILWRLQLALERHGICIFWEKDGWYGA